MGYWFRRAMGWTLCLAGTLLVLFGIWAVGAYFWGVVDVLGESDQSWFFWGLAILFIGLAAAGVGIGLIVTGVKVLRDQKLR